jgi:hypothetical protein
MDRKDMLHLREESSAHALDRFEIVKEKLAGGGADLTSLLFRHGGNVYVLSYEKEGTIKHTLIDACDIRYREKMLPILSANGINLANIEYVIITHHHVDHCGLLDLIASKSRAKILVSAGFRVHVEKGLPAWERRLMRGFDLTNLRKHNMIYLDELSEGKSVRLAGLDFPSLREPLHLGEAGALLIIGCPKSSQMHTQDQVVVIYSVGGNQITPSAGGRFRPADDIIFSGDLWLMEGPLYRSSPAVTLMLVWRQMQRILSRGGEKRMSPREQDAEAKFALKKGFCVIRVKPGHGREFIGSRILPHSILADRDILIELGYPYEGKKSILRTKANLLRVNALKEKAYQYFGRELIGWGKAGYSHEEIAELLLRIYREQSGGGPLVKQDRKERRRALAAMLARLKKDGSTTSEQRQLADITLTKLQKVTRG